MAGLAKLHEKEKAVLKLEEEYLRKLISHYQSALNALKVEELTLTNRLGQSQDLVRISRANTPLMSQTTTTTAGLSGKLPTLISKLNTTENILRPSVIPANVNETHVNQSLLNLSAGPVVNRLLAQENCYEEVENE